jgi:hypothetical protein
LLWYNRLQIDPIRTYEGIWTLVHDWVRRKRDTTNRRDALRDHLPGLGAALGTTSPGNGQDRSQMTCFQWRDKGVCAKHHAGTCEYAHPNESKGTGKSKGKGEDGGKKGNQRNSSNSGGPIGGKGSGGASVAPPQTHSRNGQSQTLSIFPIGKVQQWQQMPTPPQRNLQIPHCRDLQQRRSMHFWTRSTISLQ